MGNLTDIGYGVGKYLEASDASALPDIGTNRKNLDLLNFKVATNNAYALYNFKDGMIDAYQTEGGVDAGTSTNETYDGTNKLYSPTIVAAATTAVTATGAATWTCPTGVTSAEILVVAGGGGGRGGGDRPCLGGGGAGGVVHASTYPVTAAVVYDLSVGAGGGENTNGTNSVFNVNGEGSNTTVLTSVGGGTGGGRNNAGSAGGSGGGGGGGDGSPAGGATNQPTSFGTPQVGTGYGGAGAAGGPAGAGENEQGAGGGGANGNATDKNGGAGKQFASFMAYGTNRNNQATDYATGDRRATTTGGYITVSTDLNINTSAGTVQNFVDGSITGGTQFYPNGETSAGKYFRFDFGTSGNPIITNVKWYQDATATQGVWKWQGSNDATSWTDIGASFTLGDGATGTSTPQTQTTMSANTTAYRYYQLYGISGSASNGASWVQIEFQSRGYFGGGGGGSRQSSNGHGAGGAGGGGAGKSGNPNSQNGDPGIANTGGGGGAAKNNGSTSGVGGTGGSGFIGIKTAAVTTDMTIVSNTQTANAEPDEGRIMIYEEDVDSVTLNTDLKAYASRDGGTTYTQITLTEDVTYETSKRLLSGSVDISGQPSGTSMKYKVETLNSKNLKLHGASLLWA